MAAAKKKDDKKATGPVSAEARESARREQIRLRLDAYKLNTASAVLGSELDDSKQIYIPTGIVEIDNLLGAHGGIRQGTVAEFAGENASGKSYTALKTIAQAQKMGLRSALMNVEYSYSDERARDIGINTRDADTFEVYEGLGFAENWAKWIWACAASGEYALIVVDSVSSLIPQDTYNKDMDAKEMIGIFARFCGRFVNRLVEICGKSGTTVILINQLRYKTIKIGPKTEFVLDAMGGQSIGYWASMRLWFKKINGAAGEVKGKDGKRVGGRSQIHIKKSRQSQPDAKELFPLYFGKNEGDPIKDFLNRAVNNQFLKEKGIISLKFKVYRYVDVSTGEVHAQTKIEREFVQKMIDSPAPSVPIRGDTSKTGFEFITGRLKLSESQIKDILDAVSKEPEEDTATEEIEEAAAEFADADFYEGDDPVINEEDMDYDSDSGE